MKALKCDACGNYYEYEGPAGWIVMFYGYDTDEHGVLCKVINRRDLCSECKRVVWQFIDNYAEALKENK